VGLGGRGGAGRVARVLRRRGQRRVSVAIHCAFGMQVVLGIATVWSGVAIGWRCCTSCAAPLLACTVWAAHALGSPARKNTPARWDKIAKVLFYLSAKAVCLTLGAICNKGAVLHPVCADFGA
jgi:hypothetical protein